VLVLLSPAPAPAADEDPASPPVSLDRLLKLPDSVDYDLETRGGSTSEEWRSRFRAARRDVQVAREELVQMTQELDETSSSSSAWKVSPPGLGGLQAPDPDTPGNYQASMGLKRAKAELARAGAALRDLEIEANLAGVPDSWRRDE
jgi:hypothetical protein